LKKNNIKVNIFVNYTSKFWSIISVYAFVPIYINILGIESYGVIAFQAVLLSIVWVADSGITPAFSREAARSNDMIYLRNIFYTLEIIYLTICFIVFLLLIAFSDWFVTNWLKETNSISLTELKTSFYLMSFGVCCQLAMNLYFGGLMGRQRQLLANCNQIIYGIFRSGAVLIPLLLIPNLVTYFLWQVVVGIIGVLSFRYFLWRELSGPGVLKFNLPILKNIHKFTLGMFGMAIVAALNTQIDKLIVSHLFSLNQFAIYAIASTLSQLPLILSLPIAVSVLPEMTALVERKSYDNLKRLFHKYSKYIAIISISSGFGVYSNAYEIIFLWTNNAELAKQSTPIVKVLTLGTTFLALQLMPFHLAIANGHTQTNLKLSLVFIILGPVSIWYLADNYGLVGASITWLVLNFSAFIVLGFLLVDKFLPDSKFNWFYYDNILPIIYFSFICLISRIILDTIYFDSYILNLIISSLILLISFMLILYKFSYNKTLE
jgi:O-antigen/teichoic acid export membrane protein